MRPRPIHLRCRGFTLLELLVAMFIVSILSLSLYASIKVTFHAKASAEAVVEPPRTAAMALDMLGQDLQAASPLTAFPAESLTFEGTSQSGGNGQPADDLNFYSVSDSPLHANANGDVKNIELTTMPTPDGRDTVLVRKVIRNLLSQNATPNPDVEVICRGVAGFALQYYDGADWVPTWDSTQEDNTIPAAVQVTLSLSRPDVNGIMKTSRFTRIYPLSCSTAAQDSQVNPNADQGLP